MQSKFLNIEAEINSNFINRQEEIRGLMLATLARQHILFLGPPGTAKTQLAHMWAESVSFSFFRRLITQYTSPDELFGPIDIRLYKDEGIFKRILKGKAADVDMVLLDEVFKGGSTILNSLLSLMEERIFDNDGDAVKAPLKVMIGCSNEMPEDDSLMAFYDRFLLRYRIGYIEDELAFRQLISLEQEPLQQSPLSTGEIDRACVEVDALTFPDETLDSLDVLWTGLREESIRPSDRRYRQLKKVMAADSWLNGWDVVKSQSILVAQNILWDKPEDYRRVKRVVLSSVNPGLARANDILTAAREAFDQAIREDRDGLIQLVKQLKTMLEEVERMTGDHVEGTRFALNEMVKKSVDKIMN